MKLFHISVNFIIPIQRKFTQKRFGKKGIKELWKQEESKSKRQSCPCALTEHHAMKAYWGGGSITPRILHIGTRWRREVTFTPRPLYTQGKSPWYPLDRRLGGPHSRSRRDGEEKNSQPLPGLEPPTM
jgi:hypothetical protein